MSLLPWTMFAVMMDPESMENLYLLFEELLGLSGVAKTIVGWLSWLLWFVLKAMGTMSGSIVF
jgi:hypothetical protein